MRNYGVAYIYPVCVSGKFPVYIHFNVHITFIVVKLPDIIKQLILCQNKTCISNSEEPIDTEFNVLEEKPLKIQCIYCNRIYKLDEIVFSSKEKIEKKIKQSIQL